MADYSKAKGNKLRLKGEKPQTHKKKKRKHETVVSEDPSNIAKKLKKEDASKHGGWWAVSCCSEICGCIALEFGSHTYVKSLDDGTFTLGAPHSENEPPAPEEIFTAIRINDDKIAVKSGYGKYLKVDKDGEVVGRSDAVGAPEQWEPIFEDGKMALLGSNGCFLSARTEDDCIVATSKKAGPEQYIKLRCQEQNDNDKDETPAEDKGNLNEIEVNYVKKFQKFQDKRMRINQDSFDKVLKAKEEGKLHESLLDRRAKMKADRYCK
ncbi:unnamed protein product [Allacma fusca]|uniref:Protein FRG1 homolog n=1 Tax=Allacma fusca TaxID=39272 RepID=A0A8J2K2W4_9HEXA|nr:unnamed protein product [Allacma fusca]